MSMDIVFGVTWVSTRPEGSGVPWFFHPLNARTSSFEAVLATRAVRDSIFVYPASIQKCKKKNGKQENLYISSEAVLRGCNIILTNIERDSGAPAARIIKRLQLLQECNNGESRDIKINYLDTTLHICGHKT